jgi:hypothetical protein
MVLIRKPKFSSAKVTAPSKKPYLPEDGMKIQISTHEFSI